MKFYLKNSVFALGMALGMGMGVFVIVGVACAQSGDAAESGDKKAYVMDCSDINVGYENDPMLTEAEKLALMERAFYRSLSKFDACQDKVSSNSSSSSSASSGGGGGGGEAMSGSESSTEGGFEGESAGGTMASAESGMSGTEPPATEGTGQGQGQEQGTSGGTGTSGIIDPVIDSEQTEASARHTGGGQNPDNGKAPEDIPSVDNDSVLEAQIRQAAMAETDPVIKKRLWNEYRKYKGLPQVD